MFTPFLNLAPLSSSINCVKKDNWKLQTRPSPRPVPKLPKPAFWQIQRMILLVEIPLDP